VQRYDEAHARWSDLYGLVRRVPAAPATSLAMDAVV
jgi:hypothetical protein